MAYVKKIWKDYPDPTTQIKAEDLNNIEDGVETLDNVTKYITATAGNNGDYKVNITNSLTTGMILNIAFPAATNAASNARLSIDNGSNYKNIKFFDGTQVLASEIETTYQRMYYNGTDIILLNESYSRTNTNGTYTRYKDGTMITYQNVDITLSVTEAWGGIFAGNYATPINFPQTFKEPPEVLIDLKFTQGAGWRVDWDFPVITNSSIKNIGVGRGTSADTSKFKATIFAIGRWKA